MFLIFKWASTNVRAYSSTFAVSSSVQLLVALLLLRLPLFLRTSAQLVEVGAWLLLLGEEKALFESPPFCVVHLASGGSMPSTVAWL